MIQCCVDHRGNLQTMPGCPLADIAMLTNYALSTAPPSIPSSPPLSDDFAVTPSAVKQQQPVQGTRDAEHIHAVVLPGPLTSPSSHSMIQPSSDGVGRLSEPSVHIPPPRIGEMYTSVVPLVVFTPLAYGLWAHVMALMTAVLSASFGAFAVLWWKYQPTPLFSTMLDLISGSVSCGIALLVLYEEVLGIEWLHRIFTRPYSTRCTLYAILVLPLLFSWPTLLPAACLVATALVNRIAVSSAEYFHQDPLQLRWMLSPSLPGAFSATYSALLQAALAMRYMRQTNFVRVFIWLLLFVGGNVALFTYTWQMWARMVDASIVMFDDGVITTKQELTMWLTPAKAFGLVLDLNCALILLPVSRSLVRLLYHLSLSSHHWISRCVGPLIDLIPLDFSMRFHQFVGIVIALAAVGHTFAHFVNFATRPDLSLMLVDGVWPYVSGVLLCFIMFIMYSGSFRRVREVRFEIFQNTHLLYVLFFVVLLLHGHDGVGPNFWKFFIVPAVFYVVDRLIQLYRSRQPVTLLSTKVDGNVLIITFAKTGALAGTFYVGDVLRLVCSGVSDEEKHSFTVSSAPSAHKLTVHIKVNLVDRSSFTFRLKEWLLSFAAPEDSNGVREYNHTASDGTQSPGRIIGVDQRALFRVDGPHTTPCHNFHRYEVIHMISTGIGVTILTSALQEVVDYQWSRGSPRLQHFYLTWVVRYCDLPSYRWLLQMVRAAEDRVQRYRTRGEMHNKSFQFRIYVTSIPEGTMIDHSDMMWLQWSSGRPKWEQLCEDLHIAHPDVPVGFLICGQGLSAALRRECREVNQRRNVWTAPFCTHEEVY